MDQIESLDDKRKAKRLKEFNKAPPSTGDVYLDRLEFVMKRLDQLMDIHRKTTIKVKELEIRLDEHRFPLPSEPISGVKWTPEGPVLHSDWLAKYAQDFPQTIEGITVMRKEKEKQVEERWKEAQLKLKI